MKKRTLKNDSKRVVTPKAARPPSLPESVSYKTVKKGLGDFSLDCEEN